MMDVDLELRLGALTQIATPDFAGTFEVEGEPGAGAEIVLRAERELHSGETLDSVVEHWLQALGSHSVAVRSSNATMRLGIYLDQSESVVLPIRLSARTLRAMADLNLAMDVAGYLCRKDDQAGAAE